MRAITLPLRFTFRLTQTTIKPRGCSGAGISPGISAAWTALSRVLNSPDRSAGILITNSRAVQLSRRGAAFQVLTLLAAYRCTGEDKYLQTAKNTFDTWNSYFRSTNTKFTQGYFMVGFLLEAFIDYYEISGDSRVVDFVKQAVDWMHTNRPEEKYSNMAHGIGFLAAQLDDPSYIALQKEYLASWHGTWSNAYKDFGLHGRSLARALYYLSYQGQGYELRMTGDYDDDGALTISDLVALLVKGMQDDSNPEIDFNRDGRYSILDAVALVIYIRQHSVSELSTVRKMVLIK